MSTTIIAGIDEAGRGALAGPVVAASCIFDTKMLRGVHTKITDSKILTKSEREEAFAFLTEHCAYGIGVVEASFVDEVGILGATERAMQEAVRELSQKVQPTYLLIDGRDHFWFDIPHSSIIRGDQKEPSIAAASIIAKVHRDRLMVEYDEEFPEYGFAQHKGYGTAKHYESLHRKGICHLHRRYFLRSVGAVQTPRRAF